MTSPSLARPAGLLGRRLASTVRAAGPGLSPSRTADLLLGVLVDAFRCDGGALLVTDPSTMLFSGGAVTGLPPETCDPFFETEVGSQAPRSFARSAAERLPASALSRRADREQDEFLARVLEPFGYGDELRAVCLAGGACWGALSLWRLPEAGPFTAAAERALDEVTALLGSQLRGSVVESLARGSAGPRRHGVVVAEDGRVVEISPDAVHLLGALDPDSTERYRFLEYLTRRAADDPEMSVLLTADDGRWFTADAHPMGAPGRTVIVLSDATPTHLLTTLVAGAGLTPREVEVALCVCRGSSDEEVAARLHISPHTVHDHVKAVREKLGVSRRSAIAARLFADYYFQDFLSQAAVDHPHDPTAAL